jgi:hypothetical protein
LRGLGLDRVSLAADTLRCEFRTFFQKQIANPATLLQQVIVSLGAHLMKAKFQLLSLIVALIIPSMALHAALAPQYQNAKDLDFIVSYIKQHVAVSATLRLIDMQNHAVHFGAQCVVQFQRGEARSNAPGPAPSLEFKSANCPVD